jgi:hypothetical protein
LLASTHFRNKPFAKQTNTKNWGKKLANPKGHSTHACEINKKWHNWLIKHKTKI